MSNKSANEISKESPIIENKGSKTTIKITPGSVQETQRLESNHEYTELANNQLKTSDDLSTLRSLLLGVEPTQLNKLYERLDNPQIQAEDIGRLLPEAVVLRSKQDKQLAEAIVSTVETAIHSSVTQDHNILSEAFFPIVGPATRKAISAALEEMMQSLNQTLEHSLSPQSLRWRLEARRTGKSLAEIILLRTLVYRVEQVFLIHKQTGLLLQHLVAPRVTIQDPDLVSAMLTAIQDFVKDSFNVENHEVLHSLHFRELTIWVEEGPQAVVAVIIRGKPPQELRLILRDAIEKIHLRLSSEINDFSGDAEPFTASKPYLEACLVEGYKSAPKKNYTYAWSFLSTIAIASGIWGFFTLREQHRWHSYIQQVQSHPGIVVVNTKRQQGKYLISGMRDPLAVDPQSLIQQANLNPEKVISQWQPYLSLDPQLVTIRSVQLLQPPKTVSLKVDHNSILYASGSAPRQWILETQKLWQFIPGVTQFNDDNLQEFELSQLELYKQQIEQETLLFAEGTTDLIVGEDSKLANLVVKINQLLDIAKYLDKDISLQIIGNTSSTGTEPRNNYLSQARANKILSYFNSQGINTTNFKAVGIGSHSSLQPELAQSANRKVSFKVLMNNTSR
jgi:outer membrane protein OmpA-like peptidoglycan-associated protein